MATTRAHLVQPIYDADRNVALSWASIRVYEADGVTPYAGKIYRTIDQALTYPNPFVLAPAMVDVWLDQPTRVIIGYTPDLTKVETFTPVLDVLQDADELITTTAQPLTVTGDMVANGLLRAKDSTTARWFQPGLSPHDHHGIAPGATRLGPHEPIASRVSGFVGSTSIGVGFPPQPDFFYTWEQLARRTTHWSSLEGRQWSVWSGRTIGFAASDPTHSAMFGHSSYALGRGTIAAGSNSTAVPGSASPSVPGAISIGERTRSASGSVTIGQLATTPVVPAYATGTAQNLVSIGKSAGGIGPISTSLGSYASAAFEGVAIGFNALGSSDGSVALGAHSTFGFDTDSMYFGARAMTVPGTLTTRGGVWLGSTGGRLGFYGQSPTLQPVVGAHDVSSGIPALDSLVTALGQLGLLVSRSTPLLAYDTETLLADLLAGDHVTTWPDDAPDHSLVTRGRAPTFTEASPLFNNRPSVVMAPQSALVADSPYQAVTTYFVVASHGPQGMAGAESLVSLDLVEGSDPRESVFTAASGVQAPNAQWASTMSRFERDGADQTANKGATIDGRPHVYRATLAGAWPPAALVLGHPDDTIAPGWNGSIAEVIGVDSTWTEAELHSMSTGLAFKYHVAQDDSTLLDPATALLIRGQDAADQIHVNIDRAFASATPAVVSGSVIIPDSITLPTLPTVAVDASCGFSYRGPVTGLWRLLSQSLHWIEVYVLPTQTTALSAQYLLGRFPIDANGRWTTGRKESGVGYKVARPVLRSNNVPITYLSQNLTSQLDAQVRISTVLNGVATVEGVVPLRPDKSWFGTVRHSGSVFAELVTVSGGVVLADCSRPLPPTTIGQDFASVADLALTALALISLPPSYHFRAAEIITRLQAIQKTDGSLNEFVSVQSPTVTAGSAFTASTVLAGIAAARYKVVTRDPQFDLFADKVARLLLARVIAFGAPVLGPGSQEMLTTDAVLAYWLWKTLGYAPAAAAVSQALAGVFWNETSNRFNRSVTYELGPGGYSVDFIHDLWTDLWTTLYCDSTFDPRGALVRTALSQFKLHGVTIPTSSGSHFFPNARIYPGSTVFPY